MELVNLYPEQVLAANEMERSFINNDPIKMTVGMMGGKSTMLHEYIKATSFDTWYVGPHAKETSGKASTFEGFRRKFFDHHGTKNTLEQLDSDKTVLLFDDPMFYTGLPELLFTFKRYNFRRYALVSSPTLHGLSWTYPNLIEAASWEWNPTIDPLEILDRHKYDRSRAILNFGLRYDKDEARRRMLEEKFSAWIVA